MIHSRFILSALVLPLAVLGMHATTAAWAADMAPMQAKTEFADISKAELEKAIADKKVTLLDCNGSDSFAAGRIPGALDFAAVKGDLASKLPAEKDALIVAYCGNSSCSAYKNGAMAATKLGYTNVRHFSAGISGWKSANGMVEK